MNNHQQAAVAVPYWRLSAFYFCYFGLLGALFPYWSLYLQSLGFSAEDIGLLLALPMATKIIAPNIWGWLADHTGQHLGIIRLGAALAVLCFLGIFLSQSFVAIALVMLSYSFFWNAILPQHEAITVSFLGARPETYSRVRLWGSIGFILAVVGAGYWFDQRDISGLPVIGIILLGTIWLSSLAVPRPSHIRHKAPGIHFAVASRQPVVIAFLVGGFLLQLGHGIYYSFFSIYLESHGYSRISIGSLWAAGVIAEVIVFLLMHSLLPRIGVRLILLGSLFIAGIRWLLIGYFVDTLVILVLAQTLHAFTFGTFHAGAVECIRRLFEPGHQGKGQALYSGVSFGLGGATGSFLGGMVWAVSPGLAFNIASAVCFLAALVAWLWLKDDRLNNQAACSSV